MRIKILGCSSGIAAGLRTTSLLVDNDILVDVGTGVGDLTLNAMLGIESVFLTHSHLDHVALLPMLTNIAGPEREAPLRVYALPETIAILKQNMFNFRLWPDYTVLPSPDKPYLIFNPIKVGHAIELRGRRVIPLPAQHAVPSVGYQLDSGKASFVYSGDTYYHEPFWTALRAIGQLRYLMVEVTFLNHNIDRAEKAGHMRPELLALSLEYFDKSFQLLITHMEPGKEDSIMAEIIAVAEEFKPSRLRRGQVFEL